MKTVDERIREAQEYDAWLKHVARVFSAYMRQGGYIDHLAWLRLTGEQKATVEKLNALWTEKHGSPAQ